MVRVRGLEPPWPCGPLEPESEKRNTFNTSHFPKPLIYKGFFFSLLRQSDRFSGNTSGFWHQFGTNFTPKKPPFFNSSPWSSSPQQPSQSRKQNTSTFHSTNSVRDHIQGMTVFHSTLIFPPIPIFRSPVSSRWISPEYTSSRRIPILMHMRYAILYPCPLHSV